MNYEERIAKAHAEMNKFPPAVWIAHIQHDDWCPMMRGKHECWCTPEITLVSGKVTMLVDKNGDVSEKGMTQ